MTISIPLTLLDEQVRLALTAMCEALASAPGRLYPVVYVAPLRGLEMLEQAATAAGAAFGVPVVHWNSLTADAAIRDGTLVLCDVDTAAAAAAGASGLSGVQLIVWGRVAACDLPEPTWSVLAAAGGLQIDLRLGDEALGEAVWIGAHIDRLVAESAGLANPIVLVVSEDATALALDEAQMHIEAAGLRPVAGPAARFATRAPERDEGWVVSAMSQRDVEVAAELAAGCRREGVPLVVVAGGSAWAALRVLPSWMTAVGACTVVRRGISTGDEELAVAMEWPPLSSVWVGGPSIPAHRDVMPLPEGSSLLEALGYAGVGPRSAKVVVWGRDRLATIAVAREDAGAVVVDVSIMGERPVTDRNAALRRLDHVRGWVAVRLAVVETEPFARGAFSEPVHRVGFYFSRRDDERVARGTETGAPADSTIPVHQVARALAELGMEVHACALLRDAERALPWGVEEEMLLGYLVAEGNPEEAITRLRHAAFRLAQEGGEGGNSSWALQSVATLNALLLMVRSRQVPAVDAWGSVDRWLADAGTEWVSTPQHAAVLFELSARAGRRGDARRFADLFMGMASRADPLAEALSSAFAAVEVSQ